MKLKKISESINYLLRIFFYSISRLNTSKRGGEKTKCRTGDRSNIFSLGHRQ
jgi:hypothetical protein